LRQGGTGLHTEGKNSNSESEAPAWDETAKIFSCVPRRGGGRGGGGKTTWDVPNPAGKAGPDPFSADFTDRANSSK